MQRRVGVAAERRVLIMRRLRQRAGEESGWTLVELLVAASLGLVVVGGAVAVFVGGVRSAPLARSQAAGVQQAQTAMDRLTREVRGGTSIVTATATQLAVITYVRSATCGGLPAANAISCRVTYTCAAGVCTRVEAQPNGLAPGPAVRVVSGLTSNNVFSYVPNTGGTSNCAATGTAASSYVCVSLAFAGNAGRNAITLTDGVGLRNS
jgi:Tfp pilus assembly protein PilW